MAQDGHSDLENRVYEALWTRAEPEQIHQGNRCREITIGYGEIAEAARTDRQNAKRTLLSLIDKLSIEILATGNSTTRTGGRYRVFSYRAIIARRRAAGYTNSIRNRGGVQLWPIRPTVGHVIRPTVGLESQPVGSQSTGSVCSKPTAPVGSEPQQLIIKSKNLLADHNQPPSSTPALIVQAMTDVAGGAADRDVQALIEACRAVRPDVRPREIAHFIRLQRNAESIRAWPQFLRKRIPAYLEGTSFEIYRSREDSNIRSRFSYERNRLIENKEDAVRWLNDPDELIRQCAADTIENFNHRMAQLDQEEIQALEGE